MRADENVVVGRVGRPHGVGGAFVVDDASDDPARFEVGSMLIANGDAVRVEDSKRAGGRVVIKLDRRVDRGTALEIPRDSLPPADEDSYYVFQLVGLEVIEEGDRVLGRVRALVEDRVREVDLHAGRIVVARGFADPE